mmetsp:Transcript_13531/g.34017  ORF Transcript_13531/g.34017 Transcript_13531/m.34017 type:complete len:203 (+) Transcript_13531:2704-3312(+)
MGNLRTASNESIKAFLADFRHSFVSTGCFLVGAIKTRVYRSHDVLSWTPESLCQAGSDTELVSDFFIDDCGGIKIIQNAARVQSLLRGCLGIVLEDRWARARNFPRPNGCNVSSLHFGLRKVRTKRIDQTTKRQVVHQIRIRNKSLLVEIHDPFPRAWMHDSYFFLNRFRQERNVKVVSGSANDHIERVRRSIGKYYLFSLH